MPDERGNFRILDKKRIVAKALKDDASVSGVARKYGIGTWLLFRWKQALCQHLQGGDAPQDLTSLSGNSQVPRYHTRPQKRAMWRVEEMPTSSM